MTIDLAQVLPVLGGAGVGSVIGSVLTMSSERRQSRAGLLQAIAGLEKARWAGGGDFNDALRDVLSAALVARAPRRVVAEYVALARVAGWASRADWEESGGHDEYAGGINGELADVVTDAAALLSTVTWQPLWGRVASTWRLRRVRAKVTTLKPHFRTQIQRARGQLV